MALGGHRARPAPQTTPTDLAGCRRSHRPGQAPTSPPVLDAGPGHRRPGNAEGPPPPAPAVPASSQTSDSKGRSLGPAPTVRTTHRALGNRLRAHRVGDCPRRLGKCGPSLHRPHHPSAQTSAESWPHVPDVLPGRLCLQSPPSRLVSPVALVAVLRPLSPQGSALPYTHIRHVARACWF